MQKWPADLHWDPVGLKGRLGASGATNNSIARKNPSQFELKFECPVSADSDDTREIPLRLSLAHLLRETQTWIEIQVQEIRSRLRFV